MGSSSNSLNNNSSTVLSHATDAKAAGPPLLWNTPPDKVTSSNPSTHTRESPEPATFPRTPPSTRSTMASSAFPKRTKTNSSLPSLPNPSPLPSKLTNLPGKCTAPVSSIADVVMPLITLSSLLVSTFPTTTTSSRTPGDPTGERTVTSESVPTPRKTTASVFAVSLDAPTDPPTNEPTWKDFYEK